MAQSCTWHQKRVLTNDECMRRIKDMNASGVHVLGALRVAVEMGYMDVMTCAHGAGMLTSPYEEVRWRKTKDNPDGYDPETDSDEFVGKTVCRYLLEKRGNAASANALLYLNRVLELPSR